MVRYIDDSYVDTFDADEGYEDFEEFDFDE